MVHGSSLDFQISALPSELLPASCTNDPLLPAPSIWKTLKTIPLGIEFSCRLWSQYLPYLCSITPNTPRIPSSCLPGYSSGHSPGFKAPASPCSPPPLPHRVSSSSGVSVFPLLQPRPSPDPPACITSRLIYYNSATILRQPCLLGASLPPTPICLTRARLTFLSQRPGHHCLLDKAQAPQLNYSICKSHLVNPGLKHLQWLAMVKGQRPGPFPWPTGPHLLWPLQGSLRRRARFPTPACSLCALHPHSLHLPVPVVASP